MKRLFILILALLFPLFVSAQGKKGDVDSLVSLLSAKSMELIEKNGINYRKVTGPARFLHNNTFLICDTALWNVNSEEIDAIGNVKILQNETVLTSDNLKYIIPMDLAQFRGSLVQLEDKEHNILRTRYLDYNTKDSVALFQNGGALKDKDGQIIESNNGTYDSKIKTFTFSDNVNMFTDSIFVKTTRLEYITNLNLARFGYATDAWKDDNMLSSNSGWYDRNKELFLFDQKVHGMTPDKEGWADSLYFHRLTNNVEMLGNVQVTDTVNNVSALAGHVVYVDSVSRIVLTREPAIVGVTEDKNHNRDTVYFGADSLVYRTVPKCVVDSAFIAAAKTRLENLSSDAITTYRRKAAEEAAKAAEEAAKNDPNKMAEANSKAIKQKKTKGSAANTTGSKKEVDKSVGGATAGKATSAETGIVLPENGEAAAKPDSLAVQDSLSRKAVLDSIARVPKDSTKMGFLTAVRNARMFRKDIQLSCDSLEYSDIDSLVRMFKRPLIWNEKGRHQYAADSLYAVIRNRRMEKADLLDNAFIIVQELDSISYDQIRGAEMLAYFDSNSALRRFDVLGDASAIFYIKEDSTFSTVNKSQAKMLYADFKDGEIEHLNYFQEVKSDAYPLAQMTSDEKVLKGFEWLPDKRPKSRYEITTLTLRPSERVAYTARPRATYKQTDIYFPGYMKGVYKIIAERKAAEAKAKEKAARTADSLKVAEKQKAIQDSLAKVKIDTIRSKSDSLLINADTLAVKDSSAKSVATEKILSPKEAAKLAKSKEKAMKQAELEAKWAKLDSLDAAKAAAVQAKKQAKIRARKLAVIKASQAQEAKDNARLERYKARYEKRKARKEARESRKKKPVSKESEISSSDN